MKTKSNISNKNEYIYNLILNNISKFYNLNISEIKFKSKKRNLVEARAIFAEYVKNNYKLNNFQIAFILNRSRSNIYNYFKLLKNIKYLQQKYEQFENYQINNKISKKELIKNYRLFLECKNQFSRKPNIIIEFKNEYDYQKAKLFFSDDNSDSLSSFFFIKNFDESISLFFDISNSNIKNIEYEIRNILKIFDFQIYILKKVII